MKTTNQTIEIKSPRIGAVIDRVNVPPKSWRSFVTVCRASGRTIDEGINELLVAGIQALRDEVYEETGQLVK